MEKIEEKAEELANIKFGKSRILGDDERKWGYAEGFVDGYTTRNDEVVKMVEERIEKNKEAYSKYGLSELLAIIHDMSNLLTKLKEDKK